MKRAGINCRVAAPREEGVAGGVAVAGFVEAGRGKAVAAGATPSQESRIVARPRQSSYKGIADRTALQCLMCSCNNAIVWLTAMVLSVY